MTGVQTCALPISSNFSSITASNGVYTTDNTVPGSAKFMSVYYSVSYGTGGSGALSGVNSALTSVPDYSSAFTGIPTNNGNGTDFIITANLKSGYGGYACYRTQAQQGAAFYNPGTSLNIYAGQTVTGVNTSGNGGSSFYIEGPDIYSDGKDGSASISIVVNDRYVNLITSNASVTSVAITPAVLSSSNYIAGKTDVIYTVNAGVLVSATDYTTGAVVVAGFATGDTITIINNGTIAGGGGYIGTMGQNGSVNTTWAHGNGPNCIGTGYTTTGADGYGYGNYSGTIYWYGPGIGGNWPVYDSYSGGTGGNGGQGGNGGPALAFAANTYATIRIVQQGTSSIFVGGGGGCGGMGGNNNGGGAGGAGGYAIVGNGFSHRPVTLINNAGAIFASGGSGAGGTGNRYELEGHGGYYGASAIGFAWTSGNYGGCLPPLGIADNLTTTSIINVFGTYVVSPAQ